VSRGDQLESITRAAHLDRNWRRLWNLNSYLVNPFKVLHGYKRHSPPPAPTHTRLRSSLPIIYQRALLRLLRLVCLRACVSVRRTCLACAVLSGHAGMVE